MADKPVRESVEILEGYQPKAGRQKEAGYQPQGTRIDPSTIKPPKGGSAIQRPAPTEKKDN